MTLIFTASIKMSRKLDQELLNIFLAKMFSLQRTR